MTGFEVSVKSELSVELGVLKCMWGCILREMLLGLRCTTEHDGYHSKVNVAGFEWMYWV